jgi:hypothetical protein
MQGITRRWPPDIARASQLLQQVSSQADVSLELAVCDLLLGKATAAKAVELGLESGDLTSGEAMQALEEMANIMAATTSSTSTKKAKAPQKEGHATSSKGTSSGKAHDARQATSLALPQDSPVATSTATSDEDEVCPLDSYEWAGEWLELSVLSLFPEKAGQHVDVRAPRSSC